MQAAYISLCFKTSFERQSPHIMIGRSTSHVSRQQLHDTAAAANDGFRHGFHHLVQLQCTALHEIHDVDFLKHIIINRSRQTDC